MMKKYVRSITLLIFVIVILGLWYWNKYQQAGAEKSQMAQKMAMMMPEVEATSVDRQTINTSVDTVSMLYAEQSVTLKPEITGIVSAINFKDGSFVKKGHVLIQLNASMQKAQLSSALAEEAVAKANYERQKELEKDHFVSQQAVDQTKSLLAVATAAVTQAKVQLDKTSIMAPFNAMTGLRTISVGSYVQPGMDLLNLQGVHGYYVDFSLPQRMESKIKVGQEVNLQFDGLPERAFKAKVSAVAPVLGSADRAISMRATLENTPALQNLRAGMFARAQLVLGTEVNALMVPRQTITPIGKKNIVYIIEQKGGKSIAVARNVTLGQQQVGLTQILSGLSASDTLVLAGQDRLTTSSGTPVKIVKTVAPTEAAKAFTTID